MSNFQIMKLDLLFYMTSSENRLVNSQLYTVIFKKKKKNNLSNKSSYMQVYSFIFKTWSIFFKKKKSHVQCKEPQRITIT